MVTSQSQSVRKRNHSLSRSCFVRVVLAQLCMENVFSDYMGIGVEVAWLAQNIGHGSASVGLLLVAKMSLVNHNATSYLTILTSLC